MGPIPDPDILYSTGVVEPGTPQEEVYQQWAQSLIHHQNYSSLPPAYYFWVVIRVDKQNYSEKIEDHASIPMLIPKPGHGELVGIVDSKPALDNLTTPDPTINLRVEDIRAKYVYLTYRVKIQGEPAWRSFLEFLGNNHMLERDA